MTAIQEILRQHGRELREIVPPEPAPGGKPADTSPPKYVVKGHGLPRAFLEGIGIEKRTLERAVKEGSIAKTYTSENGGTAIVFYYVPADPVSASNG